MRPSRATVCVCVCICVHWKMISFYAQSLHAFVSFSLLKNPLHICLSCFIYLFSCSASYFAHRHKIIEAYTIYISSFHTLFAMWLVFWYGLKRIRRDLNTKTVLKKTMHGTASAAAAAANVCCVLFLRILAKSAVCVCCLHVATVCNWYFNFYLSYTYTMHCTMLLRQKPSYGNRSYRSSIITSKSFSV